MKTLYTFPFSKSLKAAGCALLLGLGSVSLSAQDGAIDPTFNNGAPFLASNGSTNKVVVDAAGYSYLCGWRYYFNWDFCILRVNPDGTQDYNYGQNGEARFDILGAEDRLYGAALQTDGKLVVTGYAKDSAGVERWCTLRLLTDGTLDSTFGQNGMVLEEFSSTTQGDVARSVLIQADGKILVGGDSYESSVLQSTFPERRFTIVRYNTDGSIDSNYGYNGRYIGFVNDRDYINDMDFTSDGSVVFVGTETLNFNQAVVGKVTTTGYADSTFGTNGFFVYNTDPNSYFDGNGIVVGANDTIYCSLITTLDDFYSIKVTPAGALDSSYGVAGTSIVDMFGAHDAARDIALQTDGKVIVAGQADFNATVWFGTLRLHPNGMVDSTFGTNGRIRTHDGTGAFGQTVAVTPDNKIVVAGNGWSEFMAVRYMGTCGPTPSFTLQPISLNVCHNDSAQFTVAGTNITSLVWQYNNGTGYVTLVGDTLPTLSIANATASEAGTYRCIATHECGQNDTTTAVTLNVTLVQASAVFFGDSLLMGSQTPNATYQWINCATLQPIAGATSVNYVATVDGDYAVVITVNGCSDTSNCLTFSTVGVNEQEAAGYLQLMPNPATDVIRIGNFNEEMYNSVVVITDMQGRIVRDGTLTSPELHIMELPAGMYIVTITTPVHHRYQTRLIKQ